MDHGRIALVAALIACGCPDDMLERAVELARGRRIPDSVDGLVTVLRDVVALVQLEAANN